MTEQKDRFAHVVEGEQAAFPDPLASAPTLAELYGPADFDRAAARSLVRLDSLPHGWGVGSRLNRLLGGGVGPGYFLAVGAASAGGGKSAWLLQLADGLAARTAELVERSGREPLTPVLVLSEMATEVLTFRSLARFVDVDSRILRAGNMASEVVERGGEGVDKDEVRRSLDKARAALSSGSFASLRRYVRAWKNGHRNGAALVGGVSKLVDAWQNELAKQTGRDVWPVVVLDPVQRWIDPAKGEIEGQNEVVELVGQYARDGGWIVLVSSDTNASAARGRNSEGDRQQQAAAALRGSYQLIHEADAVLMLQRRDNVLGAFTLKNRWGDHLPNPRAGALYDFTPTRMRLQPWADGTKRGNEARGLDGWEKAPPPTPSKSNSKARGVDTQSRRANDDEDDRE